MLKSQMTATLCLLILCAGAAGQPPQPVRLCAEWEPSFGTLIRWPLGIPPQLVVELAEDDSLYVLVEDPSQQFEALSVFISWGVNVDNCRFITADTYSHWTRDWGPYSMFNGQGQWGIIDPVFDGYPWMPGGPYDEYMNSRGFEVDDSVNAVVAAELQCPLYQFPAYLTGGNFMTDGHGIAYSSRIMLIENEPLWTHSQFLSLSEQWLGLESYFITVNPEEYGIQHIDCCAKLLDEETILLKQVASYHPDYQRLETINDQLTTAVSCYGRPYEIVRIQCDSYSGDEVAAYTNSYILNSKVLVPVFGISSDSSAIATYEEAMPGYEIIGIPYDQWYYYDALHCRTREIMDKGMLLIWHKTLDPEVPGGQGFEIEAMIHPYSGEGLIPGQLRVNWRADSGSWQQSLMTVTGSDSLTGFISDHPPGSIIDYYISAADSSGRHETLPRTAPEGFFRFTVTESSGIETRPDEDSALQIHPNPVCGSASITFLLETGGPVRLDVYDLAGRIVAEIHRSDLQPGYHSIDWDSSQLLPGCYMVRLASGARTYSKYLIITR